ncbi:uncharacterized protein B0P05DRAFT_527739 [Gilbertella persicaria]|nr:uncharacterized protein B0P05DRAFT_527739 [Gilbertella persicaria]KAI8091478.1 hypothetical protein B0P05DRAFT_527739 [Gilbertella persicaria]
MTGIKERKGNIYCQTDYNQLFLPKCQSCHKPIEKEAVVSSDGKLKGKWHKYCFKCQLCQSSFVNNQFYIYNQQPYCKLDYHKLNNTLCHSCSLPVEGECAVTSEGWRFHPSCFTCHACKTNIHHVYYVYNNHVYCQDHIPLNNIPNFS